MNFRKNMKNIKKLLCVTFTFKKDDVKKSFWNSFKTKIKRIDSTIRTHRDFFRRKAKRFQNLIRKKPEKINFSINSLTSKMRTTICKMRSIKTNIKIEAEIVNIGKIDVVKTKFRAKKTKEFKNSNFLDFSRINCF